jgi:hypothetical protein
MEFMSSPSIFTPLQRPRASEVIPGRFLAPEDLYWHDPTGCSEITEDFFLEHDFTCISLRRNN